MTNIANITALILRQHGLVECGPCTCKDDVIEFSMSVEDFKSKYSVEDLNRNLTLIMSDVVDADTGRILSDKEVQRLLQDNLEDNNMNIYYSKEIEISLKDHGNTVHAIMHWFDGNETWPYDEWSEEVTIEDVKMMSEKDIEEAIKTKLQETVDRQFNADKLYFKWKA